MVNRRQFIATGAAALPLASGAGLFSAGVAVTALYTVVHDERFDDSASFAREARRLGLRTSAVSGDVTALWYDDLHHRWRQGPAAIAGLTTAATFFCLETLAIDAGLRRILHVEHRVSDNGVTHHLDGPGRLIRHAALEACGPAWSTRMAQLAARCPAARDGRMQTTASSQVGAAPGQTLVSWVLAPLERA
jgi:hypothetical protein